MGEAINLKGLLLGSSGLTGALSNATLRGEKVELRSVDGVIQYKYENSEEWTDLINVMENTGNYNDFFNLPTINGVVMKGNTTIEELGEETLTNSELKDIIDSQFDVIFGGNH